MRTTSECFNMNKIYETLKEMSIKELHECYSQSFLVFKEHEDGELFRYQIGETFRRKAEGSW